MWVICEERCWDSKACKLYYIGDKGDVDPLSPLAKYFTGWPPGTEVYTKSKGKAGTTIIPGKPIPDSKINPDIEVSSNKEEKPKFRSRK